MKNRTRPTDHAQRPPAHTPPQAAPAFRSKDTAHGIAALLIEKKNAVDHHGERARACQQDAEEQLRHVQSREELIAEKEREIQQIRAEIDRFNTAAQNAHGEAGRHAQAQREAEYAVEDLERVLRDYAPAALELAQANTTPPGGTPATGTPPNGAPAAVTGGYAAPGAGNGTGPQPIPAQRAEGR